MPDASTLILMAVTMALVLVILVGSFVLYRWWMVTVGAGEALVITRRQHSVVSFTG